MSKTIIPAFQIPNSLDLQDSKAITCLYQAKHRELLGAFMQESRTVGQVAQLLNRDLKRIFNDVKTLCECGLLEVDRIEARAGRGTRWYRASSHNYFMPFAASRYSDYSELLAEQLHATQQAMHHSLETFLRSRDPQTFGMRFFLDPDGQTHFALTPKQDWQRHWLLDELLQAESPALFYFAGPLRLSSDQAKALQLELAHVWQRYYFAAQQDQTGSTLNEFVLNLGLASR